MSLAAAAAGGDREALTSLVLRYRRYIYAIAWKITLNEEDALDVAQEVYVRLVRRIGEYQGRGSFRAWLATITARAALDLKRRAGRREKPTDPAKLTAAADTQASKAATTGGGSSPLERLDREQRRRLVQAAMTELSPQQRAIFALRFQEELGPKEIGEHLGIPAGQVRSQLNRAMEKIREAVGRMGT